MITRIVTTQAELDAALAEKVDWIEIRSERGVWLTVRAYGDSTVRACGDSTVRAYDRSTVRAYDRSTVRAYGDSTVTACGDSTVRAYGDSTVRACGDSTVTAYGDSTVTAYGDSTVRACGDSTVTAYGDSTVRAYDRSTVRAYDRSTVRAYDRSTVRAYDDSTVTAYGDSTVTAYGDSTVTAYGDSTVTATPKVAVHLHSASVRVSGGVVIDVSKPVTDPAEWCADHGVKVSKAGVATVYKAVDDHYRSDYGGLYEPGTKPVCADWRDDNDCGGGFHFSPTPVQASSYNVVATRWLAVGVKVADLRPIPGGTAKCKAPAVVRACVEVDIDGEPIRKGATS